MAKPTPHETPDMPEHTKVVKAEMQKMTENRGPGQANDPNKGYTKAAVKNPNATEHIHRK